MLSVFLSWLVSCAIFSCQTKNNQQESPLKIQRPLGEIAQSYTWKVPKGFPLPVVPTDNPMSNEKVDLGRHLFYEPRLSLDQSMSCASCHDHKKAFSEAKEVAIGVTKEKHPRNSMALINLAYASVLNWSNPHVDKLENQMLTPLFGETPPELAMVGKEQELLERLRTQPLYQEKFKAAFPDEIEPFSITNLTRSIASFERSLISANSPYDRFIYQGDKTALSESAKRGENLFYSERLECFHCHGGFNFSDASHHAKSAFIEFNYHNTGLYNLNEKGDYPANNTGLYELTHKPADMGKFKAPTLRNIAKTAPYMHDGSIATLEAVIAHYAAGGREIVSGPYAGKGSENPNKSGFVKGFQLSTQEESDLIAFLNSLTDQAYLNNPAFSDPFQAQESTSTGH